MKIIETGKKHLIRNFFIAPFLLVLSFFVILGAYPGSGGEGAQRSVKSISDKNDFGGFIVPILYGYWPDTPANWLYSVTLLQLVLYFFGIKFISKQVKNNLIRIFFFITSTIGMFFLLQVVRDATAFSFYIFGFGLIFNSNRYTNSRKTLCFSIGIIFILTGCLFKPILSPIIAIIFLMLFSESKIIASTVLRKIGVVLLISISPFFLDKALTSGFGMKVSYPEQQLFIYDLSKMYCWGHNDESEELAKDSLKPFLGTTANYETLCQALEPMSWDDLHRKLPDVVESPSIILYSGYDPQIINELILNWLRVIKLSPFEWLQIKVIDTAQVLVMANSFYLEPVLVDREENIYLEVGNWILKTVFSPIKVLDKLRIFSLAFSFFVGFLIIFFNGRIFNYNLRIDKIILRFLLINLFSLFMLTILYIANPGRYILPFILMSYLYLFLALDKEISSLTLTQTKFRGILLKIGSVVRN
jgi:hypothetical protein